MIRLIAERLAQCHSRRKSRVRLPPVAHVRTIFFRSNRSGYPHQCALSWKTVVSEWRSVIAVSLNVGGGVRLIKPTKLYICTQTHYQHDEDGRTAPGLRGHGSVPLSHSRNVVTRIGLHTHNTAHNGPPELDLHRLPSNIWTLCIIQLGRTFLFFILIF